VMNEYIAVDEDGSRRATFPDVIATLGTDGRPVSVGHIGKDAVLAVLHIDKAQIPLSSSVRDPTVYPVVEEALGIEVARYALV
jgi:uncharacterized protein